MRDTYLLYRMWMYVGGYLMVMDIYGVFIFVMTCFYMRLVIRERVLGGGVCMYV